MACINSVGPRVIFGTGAPAMAIYELEIEDDLALIIGQGRAHSGK
jgi:hypothetical protein